MLLSNSSVSVPPSSKIAFTLLYHTSNSCECMRINGEALQLHAVHIFYLSHVRICTTSHGRCVWTCNEIESSYDKIIQTATNSCGIVLYWGWIGYTCIPPPLPTRTVAVSLIAMRLAHIWLYFPIRGSTKTHSRPTMLPQRNILHRTSVWAVQSPPDLSSHTVSFHWVACFFPSPSCSLLKVKKALRVSSLVLVFFQGCNCGRDLLSVSTKKPPMLYLFLPNQSHWKSKC